MLASTMSATNCLISSATYVAAPPSVNFDRF